MIFILRNSKQYLFLLLLVAGIFLPKATIAQKYINFKEDDKIVSVVGEVIEYLEDSSGEMDISEAMVHTDYKLNDHQVPNFGVSPSAFWLKIHFINNSFSEKLLFELSQPIMDEVDFYIVRKGKVLKHTRMGEGYPFYEREFIDPNYIFRLDAPKGEHLTFYVRIKSNENVQAPIRIGEDIAIFESNKLRDISSGLYVGLMLVMLLYNLFIYFTIKDKSYLYYVIYIVFIFLTQISLQGYTSQFIWPDIPWLAIHGQFILPALVGSAALVFMREFLRVNERIKWADKMILVFVGVYLFSLVLMFLKIYNVAFKVVELNALSVSIFMLVTSATIYKKGYRPALFFFIAWFVFLVGICIFVLKDFEVLPYNNFTRYTMQIGSSIEVILLSFALADRINVLKKEKEESQVQVVLALQENERIITQQKTTLESMVNERTRELQLSNEELHETVEELKQTQSQLVSAEKMASLGQLTAGIAHEINNPINFVVSNVKPLRRDLDDMQELIERYDLLIEGHQDAKKVKDVQDFKSEIDYDYVKEEVAILLKGIEEGAKRTSDIVKGLRTFSRLDENALKRVNIHEGIDSTLTLLNPEINGKMTLIREYGELPAIECYPGKLNQTFMNMLNNAIYAITTNKALQPMEGRLEIKTRLLNDNYITVSITDNGIGMPPEVKAKIFEPFYTTKEVGKGTGLGMSITYTIIEDHKGTIEVESEVGKGTSFIITLPITQ
jgi:signal transduction histidine kinase